MKRFTLFVLVLLFALFAGRVFSEEPHHQLIRVYIHDEAEIVPLLEMGLDIVDVSRGEYIEVVTIQEELDTLIETGFDVRVQIEDMERYYAAQNVNMDPMGGFLTYDEMVERLNLIHDTYPDLTTEPYSIGQSWEARDMWVIKVSDNPEIDEDEPELWYDGLHHAREPIGMQLLVYFIEYLMENYGVIPEVTEVVDERELFILPCANPDGYVYNQTTNPNGGGMWRKNRRDNGGGSYGVDLNRNYPYDWGHDNQGSSPNPSSATYRGPSPASEPEIQTITNYINTRHIAISHSYHSYGDLILYPWSADYNGVTPDNADFVAIANQISTWNGYQPGTAWQLLYNVNGGSVDWHYGQQDEHYKIMAFSQEVGPSFWPPASMINQLCQENLMPNLYCAQIADQYVQPEVYLQFSDMEIDDSSGNNNGSADPGENIGLTITLMNTGSGSATVIEATLFTDDPNITITSAASAYPDIPTLETGANATPFQLEITESCPIGYEAALNLSLTASGGFTDTIQIDLIVGDPLFAPTGPDNYGYLAYDQLDGHQYSAYDWIEIDPGYGGSGTLVNFTSDDQTIQVNLPFTFTYYGQDYTQVSICSNGWIAMGVTTSTDWSNSGIPDTDGPPAMAAPFWEDLSPQSVGGVYAYYDAVNHWWIVEFSRVRQYLPTTALETFEAIFFDPAEYQTITGDGLIKFQFHTVSDPSSCTVGIENYDQNDGLQILFNMTYDPNSHPIEDDAAIVFTTGEEAPELLIILTPLNPPIVIPAGGGSFSYSLEIVNEGANMALFDGWILADLPNGSVYEVMVRPSVMLSPGASILRDMSQNVPGGAPAGDYTYWGKVGNYPATVYDESSFPFSKSGVDVNAGGDWGLTGWDDQLDGISELPITFALHQNYPNPFNPMTTIEFALPEESKVKLTIYNIRGQEAAALLDGYLEAGYHTVVWNAENMPSGVYFYSLEAGGFKAVRKCVMVK